MIGRKEGREGGREGGREDLPILAQELPDVLGPVRRDGGQLEALPLDEPAREGGREGGREGWV